MVKIEATGCGRWLKRGEQKFYIWDHDGRFAEGTAVSQDNILNCEFHSTAGALRLCKDCAIRLGFVW